MKLSQLLILILVPLISSYNFSADNWNNFDAYGVKLAANDVVIVQARNKDAQFIIQFGPFNMSNISSPCNIDYVGTTTGDKNFIYNIVIPHRTYDSYDGDASIVFVGENDGVSTSPYPFVGHLRANSSCHSTYDIQLFVTRGHDEFYTVGIDSIGGMAYGFSTQFAFSYDLNTHIIKYLLDWPINTFLPRAVDLNKDSVAVVAGFLGNAENTYQPLVYTLEMNISSFNIIDTWIYKPANSSWQFTALNRDAATFTRKHVMSVAVHHNTSQVLIGMPSMNIVFWFQLTPNLIWKESRNNGYQRGFGQSVGWNDEVDGPSPVILGNAYSFPFEWSSSTIYWFLPSQFNSTDPIMPLFPSTQCPRWIDLGRKFTTMITTTFHVVILDSFGQMYVLLAAAAGSYPGTSYAVGQNPAFSTPISCQAGLYKNWFGLDICYPCSVGTMSEFQGSTECVPYVCNDTNSFCPIGSITNDTYSDLIIVVSQAQAYPKSPESIIFDDILIENMFSFGHSFQCLTVSPLFWMVVMACIAVLVLFIMGALKFFHRCTKVRRTIKRIFQQIDLIKEGELWIGGLASFSLVILLGFAFSFSNTYLQKYPIENSTVSIFSCDASLRNAKFETNVQSLSIPHSEEEQPIFDMLDKQKFTLVIDFINTKQQCSSIVVTQITHANPKVKTPTCSYDRSVLTTSLALDSHQITLNYIFNDVLSIGGLRVSLYGEEKKTSSADADTYYLIRALNFSWPFFVNNQTLASDASIELSLTRVINETDPLTTDGATFYSALWVPASLAETSKLFLTSDEFLYYGLLKPSISITISETTYFIWNNQKPIAKQSEVIFHDLLFSVVCLELFGLLFLLMKLICLPLFNILRRFIEKHFNLIHPHRTSILPESLVNDSEEKQPTILWARRPKETVQRLMIEKSMSLDAEKNRN